MKNKLVTKLIIVSVCVITLLVTFVVPSFAYTINNSTTSYNAAGVNFQLPRSNLILRNYNNNIDDVPDYLYIPTSDNYGRDSVVCGSFSSNIGDSQGVSWSCLKTINSTNVYENNGYVQNATAIIYSTAYNVDFNFYDFYGLQLGDYWFDRDNDTVVGDIYNSFSFTCYSPTLYEQVSLSNGMIHYSLPLTYKYSYYDVNGQYQEDVFTTKVFPYSVDGDAWSFRIDYFPDYIYTYFDQNGYDSQIYSQTSPPSTEMLYLIDLFIYIDDAFLPFVSPNFMHYDEDVQREQRAIGDYINRISSSSDYNSNLLEGMFDASYNYGVEVGYDEGFRDASQANNMSPFEIIVDALDSFIDWEFVPGVSVGIVLSIVVGISLLIAFLKIFAGG